MKEFKEAKLKEFDEKFVGEDVDVINGGYRKEFYATPQDILIWTSQLIGDTYAKAIEDVEGVWREAMEKIPIPSERLSIYVNVIQQIQQLKLTKGK